ncbi:hypothetical protein ES703_95498 [subsurface metagenome]
MSMLSGMIMATMVLGRQPKNSRSTPETRMSAVRMLFSRSATMLRMYLDMSNVMSNFTAPGICCCAPVTMALM